MVSEHRLFVHPPRRCGGQLLRRITRLTPIVMPGFQAMLAFVSFSTSPDAVKGAGGTHAKWSTELAPHGDDAGPHGSVVVEPGAKPNHTVVRVVISGDAPGAMRPWHLHAGTCAADGRLLGPIVGPEQSYARIRINPRGNGVAVVDLPIPFPEAGELCVHVHESTKVMRHIVTCGQLSR